LELVPLAFLIQNIPSRRKAKNAAKAADLIIANGIVVDFPVIEFNQGSFGTQCMTNENAMTFL
jgi:hypothetical protein